MNIKHVLACLHWSTYQLEYGIRTYAQEANWTLSFMRNQDDYPSGSRKVNGVIRLIDDKLISIENLYPNAKIVNVSDVRNQSDHGWVTSDNDQIPRQAFDYLRSLGHKNFVTFLLKPVQPLLTRSNTFQRILKEYGYSCPIICLDSWNEQIVINPTKLKQRIRNVFRNLDFPLAVFCPDDNCADAFSQVVLDLGYQIPGDVAVLGVNNSRDICDFCRVPLSSIDMNFSRRGYESARLLDGLMKGEVNDFRHIVVPPLTIVKRASTEHLAGTDTMVTAIQAYIREHFAEKITVETLIHDMHLTRSIAFSRFAQSVGHSIGKEIARVRMDNARYMLKNTDYKIEYVARMSGYQNTSSFCRVFKKTTLKTPDEYRRQKTKAE